MLLKSNISFNAFHSAHDINNYSSSEIRENQSSLNTEGNNTLYHTSKVESEANGNLEQDVLSLIKSISKEDENFLVYYQLCVSEALLAVRRYFQERSESTLAAHLESYTNHLKFSRWKCTNDQLDLLFQAVPGNGCSNSFDFSCFTSSSEHSAIAVVTYVAGV
ncbi:unnamed protein product [Mytilus edulis]|uniref:Uncharacterized protein n=1 Tax=Mytilus edulis TaxID=6550 RepID=A0A8S3TI59_MYTED|nr:unnamed protein product [Mytilus edulis]